MTLIMSAPLMFAEASLFKDPSVCELDSREV